MRAGPATQRVESRVGGCFGGGSGGGLPVCLSAARQSAPATGADEQSGLGRFTFSSGSGQAACFGAAATPEPGPAGSGSGSGVCPGPWTSLSAAAAAATDHSSGSWAGTGTVTGLRASSGVDPLSFGSHGYPGWNRANSNAVRAGPARVDSRVGGCFGGGGGGLCLSAAHQSAPATGGPHVVDPAPLLASGTCPAPVEAC